MEQKELYLSESQRFWTSIVSCILFCVGLYVAFYVGILNVIAGLNKMYTDQPVFEDLFCSTVIIVLGIGLCFHTKKIAYEFISLFVERKPKAQ